MPKSLFRRHALLPFALLVACEVTPEIPEPSYYEIGNVHRAVSTESEQAQMWFDRGLALSYGFNHEEAVRCFERAAAADPKCAMAYWGQAIALGPNYNSPVIDAKAAKAAYAATQKAMSRRDDCSAVERDLIEALPSRYPTPEPQERGPLDKAYAKAMQKVHQRHPDDAGIAALTAEALMQLNPWKLWSPEGVADPLTPRIRAVLEPALQRWPDHPALCHLYIHTMEAGPEVARAIPAAEALEKQTPGLGHLRHMPSHIYIWTGRYDDSVRVNKVACEKDDAYVLYAGRENAYTLYRLHNYHFVAYSAMFEGRHKEALQYARSVLRETPPGLLSKLPDLVDIFQATPYHVHVRFGRWQDMLGEPEPRADLLATRAVWHYGRGVALASLGRVEEALAEQKKFLGAKAAVPKSRLLFNNPVADILDVAEAVLAGEVEYRRGNHDVAFDHLRRAVKLDEKLNYDEPWGWMEPARHPLGALLTEQGRFMEAEEVYRRNLQRYPNNGWALHGLAECLDNLGRKQEAAEVRKRFDKAWARADTKIWGSCLCKSRG